MQKTISCSASDLDRELGVFLRRWAYVGSKNIRSFADRFCETFGLIEVPRDPLYVLPEVFGVNAKRVSSTDMPLPAESPAIWYRHDAQDCYVIRYTSYRANSQLSLALWHEFFEIMASNEAFPTRLTSDRLCHIAWLFAINVMMPEDEVQAAAAEYTMVEFKQTVVILAHRFGVSFTAMKNRLVELGCSSQRRRCYQEEFTYV